MARATKATCRIFQMYADNQQGKLVACIEASTYKWAPGNAFEKWMRQMLDAETPPQPGQYMVEGDGKVSRFNLRYPEYVYSSKSVRDRLLPSETRAIGERSS